MGCAENSVLELEFDFSADTELQNRGYYGSGIPFPSPGHSSTFNGVRVAVLAAEGVLDSLADGDGAPGVLDFNEGSEVFRFNEGPEGNVLRLSIVSESEPTELAVVVRYCLNGDSDCTGRVEGVSEDQARREYWFVLERPFYRGRVTGFSFDMQSAGLPPPVCGELSQSSGCRGFRVEMGDQVQYTTVPEFSASSNVSCASTNEPYCRIRQCRIRCGGVDQEGLTHCSGSEDGLSPPHECDD